jgi:large subunit ribosomal protein L11
MAKKIHSKVKIQIKAGQASPAPPIGPSLAEHGINIGEFCQKFNDATKEQQGSVIPVEITVYEDRSYDFKLKQPLASNLIKKMAGIEKGSGQPNLKKIAKLTEVQIEEIAKQKLEDLNTDELEKAIKIIKGTARSMGVEITK